MRVRFSSYSEREVSFIPWNERERGNFDSWLVASCRKNTREIPKFIFFVYCFKRIREELVLCVFLIIYTYVYVYVYISLWI